MTIIRTSIICALAVGVLAVSAGCASSTGQSAARTAASPSASAASGSAAASPSPSSSSNPAQAADRPVGQAAVITDNGDGVHLKETITALAFKAHAGNGEVAPDVPGTHFAAVQVKYCLNSYSGGYTIVSWQPWTLTYQDGTQFAPLDSWSPDGFNVAPLYPNDDTHQVRVGDCVKAWIPFAVNDALGQPQSVDYATEHGDSARWVF